MKSLQLILPAMGLGLGALLLTPSSSEGFALLGFSLPQTQRDFRVFNNFTDAAANNNTTAHPNFPGYTGAVMAIWKGSVEWGSTLHGNGNGDSHQSAGLGSGGANFDPSFQGLATGVGGINDNIHSELSGSSGGVLAFTESPGSNGWRIRYYSGWTWDDGPGTSLGFNDIDLQGVACHEYGHAIGMAHSTASGATMLAGIIGNGVQTRSINGDDQAGVQAAYGVASASKPVITGYSISGSTVTVNGTGFDATGNEIWFTQAGAGGTGVPIKVSGLTSGGTLLTATVPVTAGPGDILVRRNATGNAGLSNAWPFDPSTGSGPLCGFTQYGTGLGGGNIAVINSTSAGAIGTTSVLNLTGFNPGTVGQVIVSLQQAAIPFAGATILVNYVNPPATFNFSAATGSANVNLPIPNNPAYAFLPIFLQAGAPDGSLPGGWAFTSGLQLVICP